MQFKLFHGHVVMRGLTGSTIACYQCGAAPDAGARAGVLPRRSLSPLAVVPALDVRPCVASLGRTAVLAALILERSGD